ncbi:hypothetical protein Dimus_036640 [Dionaea muscipula]
MHTAACKEFYANLTVFIYKRKEIARSRVRGVEIEFDSMKLASILIVPGHTVDKQREDPKRRRDNEIGAPAEEEEVEEEAQNADFDWEKVVDETVVQGESGSDDQFFDAQVDVEEPVADVSVFPTFPASPGNSTNQQREQTPVGVDPWGPSGHIPESVMIKLEAEFERARANRIEADLEKAQAENARLLALLQQTKSPPKP